MKKLLLSVLFYVCGFLFLYALEFPSDSTSVKSTFGQKLFKNIDGLEQNFESGIRFENATIVQASDFGKNILVMEKRNDMNGFPSALNNAMILLHENGYQTVYGNLNDVQNIYNKDMFFKSEIIGGTALDKNENHMPLLFKVIDIRDKSKNFVNPLFFLPKLLDGVSPKIVRVLLQNSDKKMTVLSPHITIARGKYKLFVETFDTINASDNRLAPFDVTTSINGNTVSLISFQTLRTKNGNIETSEGLTLSEIYRQGNLIYLCDFELSYGNAKLSVIVRDYYKNTAEQTFEITAF